MKQRDSIPDSREGTGQCAVLATLEKHRSHRVRWRLVLDMNPLGVCIMLALAVYVLLYNRVLLLLNLAILIPYYLLARKSLSPAAQSQDSVWRRMRIAMWEDPFTPEVLGEERVLMSKALRFVQDYSRKSGKKVTVAHALLKAAGIAVSRAPEINGKIAFGAYAPYDETRVSTFIPADNGETLKWVALDDVEKKSLGAISDEMKYAASQPQCPAPLSQLSKLPTPLLSFLLEVASLVTVQLGIAIPALGLQRHQFGSVVVTNYGDIQADMLWAPVLPFARTPISITSTKIVKDAVALDGKVVVEDVFHLTATLDHRFIDGTRGAVIANDIKKILENPEEYFT